jgi:oxygen-dependent protoporphyrinogen oxidase
MSPRAVVVGGGVTGLVAARSLAEAGASVTVVEPDRPGGKLQASPFDGGVLDEAADAFLARVPDGVELCRALGLEGDLVSPAARRAHVWSHGALRLLPEEQVLGVPTDLDALAESGIVSPAGLRAARADLERPLVAPAGDVTIGSVLRQRLGDEVAERLVDPLVGGISAGDTDQLSLAATVPQLDAAVRSGAASLIEATRAQRALVVDRSAPVFFAPRGGMAAIPEALRADLDRRDVAWRTGAADGIARDGSRWRVALADGEALTADVVVVATPAPAAAGLLRAEAGRAATLLAAIPYASVAMVALAVPPAAIERELDGSGYLVPRVEGRTLTACSWTTSKWPHLHGDGTVWLRASVGRDGADAAVHLPDDELVAAVLADLRATMALRGTPTEVRVRRWLGSFPQYRVGHLERVEAIDDELAARAQGLVVAGAALRGLGVPACIRQGQAAARRALAAVGGPS